LDEAGAGTTVDISDAIGYAKAIEAWLNHPTDAAKMGLAGRKAVEDRFNWTNEAEKLLHLYNGLTA